MNISDAVKEAIKILAHSGSATPRLDAEVLLSFTLEKSQAQLHINHDRELPEENLREFLQHVERRSSGEPVAYIVGQKEFWSLLFLVNRHVLIPRPETEILVEETLRICSGIQSGDLKILEIGTGSGAISIALAHELPSVKITATDISQDALDIAVRNARVNNVETLISFIQGNLYEPVSGRFDLIVSNPPYIPKEEYDRLLHGVHDFEPETALLAGNGGTAFHRAIIEGSISHLKPGGWLLMEIGAGQKDRVEFMLNQSNLYDSIAFKVDYAGMIRVCIARRVTIGG